MRLTATVVQDRKETWFEGKKDEVEKRIWTVLDLDPESDQPMVQTLDYRPTDEEAKAFPDRSLVMKQVTISVRDLKPGRSGRIVILGSLLEPKPNAKKTPGV